MPSVRAGHGSPCVHVPRTEALRFGLDTGLPRQFASWELPSDVYCDHVGHEELTQSYTVRQDKSLMP